MVQYPELPEHGPPYLDDLAQNLDPKQQRVLEALLMHDTKKDAAKALGIGRTTLYMMLKDPYLAEAYEMGRRAKVEDTIDTSISLTEGAILVLHQIAHDPDTPQSVRVQAASKLVDIGLRSVEAAEILARIENLERELV